MIWGRLGNLVQIRCTRANLEFTFVHIFQDSPKDDCWFPVCAHNICFQETVFDLADEVFVGHPEGKTVFLVMILWTPESKLVSSFPNTVVVDSCFLWAEFSTRVKMDQTKNESAMAVFLIARSVWDQIKNKIAECFAVVQFISKCKTIQQR